MMIGAALLYALHLLINQRILFDAPAPTVTFYTLISMTLTVIAAYALFDRSLPTPVISWTPILILGAITFLSRISLFLGVKHIGGLQTALMGLGELLITIALAHIFLGDQLSIIQWIGAGIITINILLVIKEKPVHPKVSRSLLFSWLSPPKISSSEFPQQG
jgi:drug/metabolite transporter (DMT)-like permease